MEQSNCAMILLDEDHRVVLFDDDAGALERNLNKRLSNVMDWSHAEAEA